MNSFPRAFATALVATLAAFAWAAAPARAEKADRQKDIQVLADRLSADDAKKEAVYEGNVVITQGTMRITSERIVVREDAQGFRTYVATGSPVTFRQKRDNVDEWIEAYAQRAEFDDRNELLKLFDNARLKSAQGELTGDYITYDRGKELFQATGTVPGKPDAGARVKATIIPQKKGDGAKAEPAPAAPPVILKPDQGRATGG